MNWKDTTILFLDTETTGLHAASCRIIEVGYAIIKQRAIAGWDSFLINPEVTLPEKIIEITGIVQDDVKDQPTFVQVAGRITQLMDEAAIIGAYNVPFDRPFFAEEFKRVGQTFDEERPWIDPLDWVRNFDKYQRGKKLIDAATRRGIKAEGAHRAAADAVMTAKVALSLFDKLPDDFTRLLTLQGMWHRLFQVELDAYRARQARQAQREAK